MSYYPGYNRRKYYGQGDYDGYYDCGHYYKGCYYDDYDDCYEYEKGKKYYGYHKFDKCGCCERDCDGRRISKYRNCPKKRPVTDTLCDCCYKPLEYALKQLVSTGSVEIWVETGGAINYTGPINWVRNGIVKMQAGGKPVFIPVCRIVEAKTDVAISIDLLKPCCRPRTGECRCCECNIRKQLKKIKEANLKITWTVAGINSPGPAANIVDIGEGVVILSFGSDVSIVPICKISSFEVVV